MMKNSYWFHVTSMQLAIGLPIQPPSGKIGNLRADFPPNPFNPENHGLHEKF